MRTRIKGRQWFDSPTTTADWTPTPREEDEALQRVIEEDRRRLAQMRHEALMSEMLPPTYGRVRTFHLQVRLLHHRRHPVTGQFNNRWTGTAADRASIAHACGHLAGITSGVATDDLVITAACAMLGAAVAWVLAPLTRK
jgi:hypothetical protein